MSLSREGDEVDLLLHPTSSKPVEYNVPEKEIAYGPACYLVSSSSPWQDILTNWKLLVGLSAPIVSALYCLNCSFAHHDKESKQVISCLLVVELIHVQLLS